MEKTDSEQSTRREKFLAINFAFSREDYINCATLLPVHVIVLQFFLPLHCSIISGSWKCAQL